MSHLSVVKEGEAPREGWECKLKTDKSGNPRAGLFNAMHILENDEETCGFFRFNDVSRDVDVTGGVFAKITDALDTEVARWLEEKYSMAVSSALAGEALLAVGYRHRYDPLRDYLRGLVWDGVRRIDDLLIKIGAITKGEDEKDRTEHFRRISRRWFIAGVNRALVPGSQMDVVLVLKGKQGIKKTTFFRALGGAFFCDTELDLRDKDAKLIAGSNWIIELAELTSLRRGGSKGANGFVTSLNDQFRPPYGRRIQKYPRRCCFVGTCNDDEFLADNNGHRRFWIVPLHDKQIDVAAIAQERDQIWAEAVAAFDAGEKHYLEADEAEAAEEVAHEFAADAPFVDSIRTWWNGLPVKGVDPEPPKEGSKLPGKIGTVGKDSRLTGAIVATQALGLPEERLDGEARQHIGSALTSLGFKRGRETSKAGGARYYKASLDMIAKGLG